MKYVIVRSFCDAKIQQAIEDARTETDLVVPDRLRDKVREHTQATSLVEIVDIDLRNIPKDRRDAFLRDAVAYPLTPEGNVIFGRALYGPKPEEF